MATSFSQEKPVKGNFGNCGTKVCASEHLAPREKTALESLARCIV